MIYVKSLFVCIFFAVIVTAQIPNFGRCPEYEAMENFDRESFLGKWYEIERYFAVNELASRCVSVTYERRADGKIYVNNEMINRFTNVQRIVSGVINQTAKYDDVATFTVKYTGIPVNYDTTLHVLDTDYDTYAVVWSCNPLAGPVGHTESLWIMSRKRQPCDDELQKAYGLLDKMKISRTFFVKTDQDLCETDGDAVDTGYDTVGDDDDEEEASSQHVPSKPQIQQVQHIHHVENLQQFSPPYPVPTVYRPHVHNHGQTVYFKQNDVSAEKSATEIAETENKISETKAIETKTEQVEKIAKTEQPAKIEKTDQAEKSEKMEPTTKLPTPMNEIIGVNATARKLI